MEEWKELRKIVIALFVPVILYQIYVVVSIYRSAPVMTNLLSSLAAEPPIITRCLIRSYKFFAIIPVLSSFFAIDIYRRKASSVFYLATALSASLLMAFIIQAWANEAWFTPIFQVIEKIK